MKPHNNIGNPKIPIDRNSFLIAAEVNIRSNAEPNTTACLTNDVAEFLTVVGNNSIVNVNNTLYAKQEKNKDARSRPICMPSLR